MRKTTAKNVHRLLDFLSRERKTTSPFLILTHNYPDPDALASSFAFAYLAKRGFNISCQIVYGGIIGRAENQAMVKILKIPARKFKFTDLKKYSNIVLIDTQPEFDNNPFPSNRKATIVIDQHPSLGEKPFANLSIVDTECGATSVILAQALFSAGIEIPKRIGTALAYGILTDTLNLYRARRSDIIKTYINLLTFCDMRALTQIQNPSRSRRFFITLGKGINEALIYGKLIISHLGWVENPDVVSQVTEFLLTYEGMSYSFCTGRYKKRIPFSLRAANPNFLAANILRNIVKNPRDAG
ncbi:MAG: DHH family phosphoesterase, partial [Desulfobacterota bacterium]|nr:DHH family phosphoesterase [Thermodesulfobacteriota bacterium]